MTPARFREALADVSTATDAEMPGALLAAEGVSQALGLDSCAEMFRQWREDLRYFAPLVIRVSAAGMLRDHDAAGR